MSDILKETLLENQRMNASIEVFQKQVFGEQDPSIELVSGPFAARKKIAEALVATTQMTEKSAREIENALLCGQIVTWGKLVTIIRKVLIDERFASID